jgi:pantothenate kinase type III
MRIREHRGIVVREMVGKSHTSAKKADQLLMDHEEIVAAEAGLAKDYLTQYVPQLENQVKALEEFVANLDGKFIISVDPNETSKITEVRKDAFKVNLQEMLFKKKEEILTKEKDAGKS